MTDGGNLDGPLVSEGWVTSQRAVNAFTEFCLAHKWVFTETPEQTDFGKDGYLDFSQEGLLTGQCIAVQIKGGESFRRRNGYTIPADRRRRTFWRESTVPVFGIVWDPQDGALYWTELTRILQEEGVDAPLRVPTANRLRDEDIEHFLASMWRATTGTGLAPAFGSDDTELQEAAVYDCYGLGRWDPRYLILLRRAMFGFQPDALDFAIHVLNWSSLNTDILKDPSWMSLANRQAVRAHFVWTIDEAIQLLDRVQDDDWFERGCFSLCIYWLLVGPTPAGTDFVDLVEAATLRASADGRDHAAKWGLSCGSTGLKRTVPTYSGASSNNSPASGPRTSPP
jgi:Domain of unknown function (DUF4365)